MSDYLNIAVIIDVYKTTGGAFRAAMKAAKSLRSSSHTVTIVCTTKKENNVIDGVVFVNSVDSVIDFIRCSDLDAIVFMKAAKSSFKTSILKKFIKAKNRIGVRLPIITVICQQPANFSTILTPYEINNSDHLIFIDRTAYETPLYDFIPKSRKSWTYLSIPETNLQKIDQYCKTNYDVKNNTIVFGRGSSLGKCPKDILDIYDKISAPQSKLFVIAGVYPSGNWLSRKVARRDNSDVILKAPMPYEEWLAEASTFDIFLYYLPTNSHSSIDGTLGQVMLMGIPVVVYGPQAPKERIEHGVNGFIANTKNDFIKYAEQLAADSELRKKIGREARLSTIKLNSANWTDHLVKVINAITPSSNHHIKTPFLKYIYINVVILLNYVILLPSKFLSFIERPDFYLKH